MPPAAPKVLRKSSQIDGEHHRSSTSQLDIPKIDMDLA